MTARTRLQHRFRSTVSSRGGSSTKASLPLTALVDQFYSEVQKLGGRRWDTSSLVARLNNQHAAPSAKMEV